jgi:hypothetical protein
MPTTVGGTTITFNDSTNQGSAWVGARNQIFTGNGTFTIPTGVTAIKATVIGAGGGANSGVDQEGSGNGGGGGGTAVKFLSGLTSGATLTVTVGGGSTGTGGASSLASGNQSITTVTANGGTAGSFNTGSNPGNASNGDFNMRAITYGGGSQIGGVPFGQYSCIPTSNPANRGTANGAVPGGGAGGVNAGLEGDGPQNASATSGAGRVIIEW